jgi:hypothetical protein
LPTSGSALYLVNAALQEGRGARRRRVSRSYFLAQPGLAQALHMQLLHPLVVERLLLEICK